MNEEKLLQDLQIYAHIAVQVVKDKSNKVEINEKTSKRDLVTNVDRLVEQKLIELITNDYPDGLIISEEYHHDLPEKLEGLVFFIDPIDGTMNFVHQRDHFASMIGVYEGDHPIAGIIVDIPNENYYYGTENYGIFKNERQLERISDVPISEGLISVSSGMVLPNKFDVKSLIKLSLGLRIIGSAGIEFTELLDGKQIGYLSRLAPWDLAAGRFLAESLGFIVTKIDGTPPNMIKSENVIISTKQLHEIAIEHLHDKL